MINTNLSIGNEGNKMEEIKNSWNVKNIYTHLAPIGGNYIGTSVLSVLNVLNKIELNELLTELNELLQ